jgi:hypothetical protein
MRTIRISEAVWAAIAERGKFGETADTVLRREFDLPSGNDAGRTQIPSGRRGRGNLRYAEKRMSPRVEAGQLSVGFEQGPANHWDLSHPSKTEDTKRVLNEAAAFARKQGATPGQVNAIRKALTEAGYHLIRR